MNNFINADISAKNCIEYMMNAEACNDINLISVATEVCAKNFSHCIRTDALLSLSPERFQYVVNLASTRSKEASIFYSIGLMKYMDSRPDDLSSSHPDAYQELLCCKKLHSIDISASIFFLLLDIEDKFYKCTCKRKCCLYDRCVKSYAINWSESSLGRDLGSLPMRVQIDLMRAALTCGQTLTRHIVPKGSQILMRGMKTREFPTRFDSLERMDQREILVSGAGIGDINGVYVLVELFDGYRRYSKGVIVGGEPRLSSIEAKKGVGSVYWELGGFFIGVYSIRDAAASTDIANAYPPIGQWKLKQGTALNNKTATVSYLS